MAVVVTIAAVMVLAGVLLEYHPTQPGLPNLSGSGVLFSGQAQGVNDLYQGQFVVPALSGPNASVDIEELALVNVTCGGASYWNGADYNCIISLISGPLGGPTVDQLWSHSFSGVVVSNMGQLPTGFYTLLVQVLIGSAPGAVLSTPFNVLVEVVALS